MNADEIKSLIVKLLLMLFTTLAAKFHIDSNTMYAIASDVVDVGILVYGVANHWNMKKVPETAKVIGALVLLFATSLIATSLFAIRSASAADMPIPLKAPAATPSCTIASCSGWYLGAHLDGMGTNADIIGSGLGGSVFADGGALGLQGGYQLWNGNFFAAIEVGGSYYIPANGQQARFSSRFTGTEFIKLGYGLANLFNAGTPSPSQGPVALFNTLQANLISPYLLFGGDTRAWGTGWAGGAGAEYTLGNGYNLFAEYFHASFNRTTDGAVVNTDNVVRIGVNRKF